MRVAVVGHVEWVEFARVTRVPRAGEIAHARDTFAEPAGGGAVAAVQLARLAGGSRLLTAFGDDALAQRNSARLSELGVDVRAVLRSERPTRRAFTFLDDSGERTITTIGARHHPRASDPLPWSELENVDAVYFCAGDEGALRAARAARVLVAATRSGDVLQTAGVALDAVVSSAVDPAERYRPIEPAPRYVVTTDGARGGTWSSAAGGSGRWVASELPGAVVDSYGAGDSFAAGLTFGLAASGSVDDALALAARCGATCMTGRGPYGRQLVERGQDVI